MRTLKAGALYFAAFRSDAHARRGLRNEVGRLRPRSGAALGEP